MCNALNSTFPSVEEGGKCDRKTEWEGLKNKVGEVCELERVGSLLVQGVEVMCQDRDTLAGQVEGCVGDGSLSSEVSDGSSGAMVVTSSMASSVSGSVGASSSTSNSETPSAGESSFASPIQHGVASAGPGGATASEFNWPSSTIAITMVTSTSTSTSTLNGD
jgi:hypothetical protein